MLANEQVDPAEAIDAMEQNDPIEPMENELPMEPIENELPMEPMEQNDPIDPMERALPSEPTDRHELEWRAPSRSSDHSSLSDGLSFDVSVVATLRRFMNGVATTAARNANSTTTVRVGVQQRPFIFTSLRSESSFQCED
jgi:hypothetical protein